jgi:hypothetical protein
MVESNFVPITITGCDEERVKKASSSKKQFVFPFSLSDKPPRSWGEALDDAWHSVRKKSSCMAKARAYVKKSEILLECPLDALKELFADLKAGVAEANEKYQEELREKVEKESRKQQKREQEMLAEKAAIHETLQGLDFS